ncbi:hypothetical protein V5T82_02040 [Magnetovibrio sp. PR-2]|uniref:hypothetical protein n=1 Tax=Magnetovibrio sp. PR-2 TaxID=3120356 RepID=UPI002FCE2A1D
MHISFTVWQFVRVMVYLEEVSNPSPDQKALCDAWAEIWKELDQQLNRLAEDDFDAYSQMMMDQDLIIDDALPAQIETAKDVLEKVMAQLDKLQHLGGEDEYMQSLKFERRELRQLARKFGRLITESDT